MPYESEQSVADAVSASLSKLSNSISLDPEQRDKLQSEAKSELAAKGIEITGRSTEWIARIKVRDVPRYAGTRYIRTVRDHFLNGSVPSGRVLLEDHSSLLPSPWWSRASGKWEFRGNDLVFLPSDLHLSCLNRVGHPGSVTMIAAIACSGGPGSDQETVAVYRPVLLTAKDFSRGDFRRQLETRAGQIIKTMQDSLEEGAAKTDFDNVVREGSVADTMRILEKLVTDAHKKATMDRSSGWYFVHGAKRKHNGSNHADSTLPTTPEVVQGDRAEFLWELYRSNLEGQRTSSSLLQGLE